MRLAMMPGRLSVGARQLENRELRVWISPSAGAINIRGRPTVPLARLALPAAALGSREGFVAAVRKHRVRPASASCVVFSVRRHVRLQRGAIQSNMVVRQDVPRRRLITRRIPVRGVCPRLSALSGRC